MNILDTRTDYLNGEISKPDFIRKMYQHHHSKLFDYAKYIKQTNIASIEIFDDKVIVTSRDNGVKMICPEGEHRVAPIESLNFLDYETIDSAMIMRLISPEDCVIDIGANMGWYSINIAKVFPKSKVYAFEPIPKTYAFLTQNIQLNNISNIKPFQFGLSNEKKDLVFYFYPEGGVNASLANVSEREDVELIKCHVERLDDFVAENELKVDFIKCDVEGAEIFAFKGAFETLKRDKPIVFTEMLRKWSAKFNYHPNEIISMFSSIGYKCFYCSGTNLIEIEAMTDETIETNFFFLHAGKHQQIIAELSK
ncbi:MAG: FkbM family methyltransferase [Methylophilus sp.]